ncbi:hypothetical protein LSH36_1466g00016 [Paralvinella palmiformis]|uniref:Uncharacterized protein n=1 Tax=Paralvinella palmiformis TaxID=53620 RepID=A0AAD9MNW9_9ANNE|nr:hypothetical protein LSH36_1466g00016 [Paralvinella palmiformis]
MAYRKAAYHCLSNQVPVETVGYVIASIVKELAGGQLDYSADKKNYVSLPMNWELLVIFRLGKLWLIIKYDNCMGCYIIRCQPCK